MRYATITHVRRNGLTMQAVGMLLLGKGVLVSKWGKLPIEASPIGFCMMYMSLAMLVVWHGLCIKFWRAVHSSRSVCQTSRFFPS